MMAALLESWSDNTQGIEAAFALLIIVSGFATWLWQRHPRRRLRSFYKRTETWWNEFYLHVGNREDDRRIGQIERGVSTFLEDSGLHSHVIMMTPQLRAAFLRPYGLKAGFSQSPEIFRQYTKLPYDRISIEDFWLLLTAAAYRFRSAWPDCTPENALQNIENPLKCLRVYCGYREK